AGQRSASKRVARVAPVARGDRAAPWPRAVDSLSMEPSVTLQTPVSGVSGARARQDRLAVRQLRRRNRTATRYVAPAGIFRATSAPSRCSKPGRETRQCNPVGHAVSWLTLLDSPWRYCYPQRMAKKKTSACMSKDPSKKRDSNTGEWRARTGLHNRLDTGQLRALDGVSGVDELQRGALPA